MGNETQSPWQRIEESLPIENMLVDLIHTYPGSNAQVRNTGVRWDLDMRLDTSITHWTPVMFPCDYERANKQPTRIIKGD